MSASQQAQNREEFDEIKPETVNVHRGLRPSLGILEEIRSAGGGDVNQLEDGKLPGGEPEVEMRTKSRRRAPEIDVRIQSQRVSTIQMSRTEEIRGGRHSSRTHLSSTSSIDGSRPESNGSKKGKGSNEQKDPNNEPPPDNVS